MLRSGSPAGEYGDFTPSLNVTNPTEKYRTNSEVLKSGISFLTPE
jgi:hypothetical protein